MTHGPSLRSSSADLTPRCVVEGRTLTTYKLINFLFFTLQNEHSSKMTNKVSYYSTDEQALRKILTDDDMVDWSTYFVIGG